MGLLDTQQFERTYAAELLRRIAEASTGGTPPENLWTGRREQHALLELERRGLVQLIRGKGALAFKIEQVLITEAGREKLSTL